MPDSPCIGAGRYGRDCGALPYLTNSIDNGILPDRFVTLETYPNPFNSDIRIKYYLINPAEVQLEIINLLGQKVKSIENGFINSGSYILFYKPEKGLSSGTYMIRFSADNYTAYRKITYLK